MTEIILTDDDPSFRELLGLFLERAGCVVHHAAEGSEALSLYAQHPGAVIVLDMIMPGMEGMETILEFSRRYPEARIIAISGGGRVSGDSHLKLARHLGAKATLAKPFHPDDLLRMIQDVANDPTR